MPQETQQNTLDAFKTGVDALLERREYFIRKIFPRLEKDRDYYEIKGRRSLGKAGAEKIGASYSFVATFRRDSETLLSFKNTEGLIALVCDLTRNNVLVGQGRGAAELKNNNGDVNKTIKMCQKSAFIDAVIRASGLYRHLYPRFRGPTKTRLWSYPLLLRTTSLKTKWLRKMM